MAKFDVAVVGELNLDLILSGLPRELQLEREHLADGLKVTLGSSSAIFAHNLASLGDRVAFHSAIGDDSFGELCLERLREIGVDLSGVHRLAQEQTGLTVILSTGEQRYILTYPGAMAELRFEDLSLEHICSAKHFHLSSYFLQTALRPRMPELFRRMKQAGLTTSLDTNDDPADEWSEDVLEVLKYVDLLLPNTHEACKLAKRKDAESAAEVLSAKVPLVAIKCGSQGAIARRGKEIFQAPSQRGEFVDAVGAGDSFDAGFIHKFIRGASIEECLRFANITGALSVTRSGGTEAFRDQRHRQEFLGAHQAGG
ncbi:MAG TPA: carbohydrate kinase family protein [Candidatus Acidoferrum sp.]